MLVRNVSDKKVRFFGFFVTPAACPAPVKPLAKWVAYGDWTSIGVESDKPTQSALLAKANTTLVIPANLYRDILEWQIAQGCRDNALPELVLVKVAYCDGTGWAGIC